MHNHLLWCGTRWMKCDVLWSWDYSRKTTYTSCIMRHASCVMHHASCIMHHASCIMHHASWISTCMMHDAWCMMHDAWCGTQWMKCDVTVMWSRDYSRKTTYTSCIMRHALCIMHHASCIMHIMHHALCIVHHASCIVRHASCIVRHASCIIRYSNQQFKSQDWIHRQGFMGCMNKIHRYGFPVAITLHSCRPQEVYTHKTVNSSLG